MVDSIGSGGECRHLTLIRSELDDESTAQRIREGTPASRLHEARACTQMQCCTDIATEEASQSERRVGCKQLLGLLGADDQSDAWRIAVEW